MAVECCYLPKRYIFVCLAHLGFFVSFALRVNLSVALVAMVNDTQKENSTDTFGQKVTTYDWDESQQGILLSSFFYGYLFTQLPGGYLAHRLGGKWVFFVGVFLTCLLTALTPLMVFVREGFYMLLALRVLEGVAQGVVYPSMHGLLSKWTTNEEKGFFASIVYAGACTGTVAMLPVSSVLCDLHFLDGWPSAFYIPAFVGIVWCIFWGVFVCDSPETHSTISDDEKMLLLASHQPYSSSDDVRSAVPWVCILRSPPVYALVISYFCNSWVFSLILTDLPSYFQQVLKFSLEENGILSAVPYLSAFIATVGAGWLADWLTKRYFSVTTVRKLLTVSSFYLTALCMVLVSFVGCDQRTLPVVYLVIATGTQAINTNFYNHLDLAPRYGDVLMAITNTFSTIAGCITPVVTGYFINKKATRKEYMKVFLLAAGVSVLGGTMYAILGSGELQDWNDGPRNDRVHVYLDEEEKDGEDDMLIPVDSSERELLINC